MQHAKGENSDIVNVGDPRSNPRSEQQRSRNESLDRIVDNKTGVPSTAADPFLVKNWEGDKILGK